MKTNITPENRSKIRKFTDYTYGLWSVDQLMPVDYNPNEIGDESEFLSLVNSMDKDPDFIKTRPLIVNSREGREGFIAAGHKRWLAAKELGWKKIPVMFVNMTEAKEKDWNLKDNKHNGVINKLKEKEVLIDLKDLGHDMTSLNYTPSDLVDIMEGVETDNVDLNNDPDYQGTTPSKPYVKCPECGHTAAKGEFEKLTKQEFEDESN